MRTTILEPLDPAPNTSALIDLEPGGKVWCLRSICTRFANTSVGPTNWIKAGLVLYPLPGKFLVTSEALCPVSNGQTHILTWSWNCGSSFDITAPPGDLGGCVYCLPRVPLWRKVQLQLSTHIATYQFSSTVLTVDEFEVDEWQEKVRA